jgi:hypothetical protein
MKFSIIYKRRGKLIIGAQGRTTAGVLIGVEPPLAIDETIDASSVGRTLRDALNRSRSPVPHPKPEEWPAITDVFLRSAGVKSWSTFVRGSLLATVESDGSMIIFQPHENRGARDAFQPMGLPSIRLDAEASDAELGEAAARALEIAASAERSHDARPQRDAD